MKYHTLPAVLYLSWIVSFYILHTNRQLHHRIMDNGTTGNTSASSIDVMTSTDVINATGTHFTSGIVLTISAVGLFPIGIIGNMCTIFTLLQTKNRNSATAIFIMVLAFSDNIILLTGSFFHWFIDKVGLDLYSDVGCKLWTFFNIASIQISSWILATISIERAVLVTLPLKAHIIFTKKAACVIASCVVVAAVCLNIPVIIANKVHTDLLVCDTLDFYINVFPVIDFSFTFLLLFIILVVTSIIIIAVLWRKLKGKKASSVVSSVAITMLLVNLTFIVTIMPFCVYQMTASYRDDTSRHMTEEWYMLIQLSEINPILNVPLYCLGNPRFRQEINNLLTQWKTVTSSEGVFGDKVTD